MQHVFSFFGRVKPGRLTHIDTPELGLRQVQGFFNRPERGRCGGIGRGICPGDAPVHDCFSQAQGQVNHPIFGPGQVHRVIIIRTRHPRQFRVEAVMVAFSHHLLDDHGHFFIHHPVPGRPAVVFGIPKKGGSIHKFNRLDQAAEPFIRVEEVVWNHFRVVDSGKRLMFCIFQQAG